MLGSNIDGLPIDLRTDVNNHLQYNKHQKLCIQNCEKTEEEAWRNKHLLQLSGGWDWMAKKGSWSLQGRIWPQTAWYFENTWTPHGGQEHYAGKMQSLHDCITRKECRIICSIRPHVNKYATHVYLHKHRIIGLLQRGEEEG